MDDRDLYATKVAMLRRLLAELETHSGPFRWDMDDLDGSAGSTRHTLTVVLDSEAQNRVDPPTE